MAKKSWIARNDKRKTVEKYAENAALKGLVIMKTKKLPRNASPTRVRNRCSLTGRGRGYIVNMEYLIKFRISLGW